MTTQLPRLTETVGTLLRTTSGQAEQLGWALRELGIGVVTERSPDGGAMLRLTAYRGGAQLSVVADELLEGLADGWQSADEHLTAQNSEETAKWGSF